MRESSVLVEFEGDVRELDNDVVIVCAGGILPTAFLKSVGIEVATRHGEVMA